VFSALEKVAGFWVSSSCMFHISGNLEFKGNSLILFYNQVLTQYNDAANASAAIEA
jgi:hypothetical protein